MSSMPQQAVANGMGHTEDRRAQLMTRLSDVVRNPSTGMAASIPMNAQCTARPVADDPTIADDGAMHFALLGSLALALATTPTLDELKASMPSLRTWQQTGWTILSDAPRGSVQQVQRTLERTRQEWDRFLRLMERPRDPGQTERLCIVFAKTEDFEHFAATYDNLAVSAEQVPGYFSPQHRWIIFLDPGDHADLDDAWQRIDDAQREVDDAAQRGHSVDEAQRQLEHAREELASSEVIRRMALTSHETVHQLVHQTPAFPYHAAWPQWLHEGLSTAFETADRRRPFGPDRDFAQRRTAFLDRLDTGTASTIDQLLLQQALNHADEHQVNAAYVDGCALVSWLSRSRRAKFALFLEHLGRPDDTTGETPDIVAVFKAHLGDPAALTRSWWADERRRR